jgi:hypothetical protein
MNGYCTRGTFGAWQQIAPKQKKNRLNAINSNHEKEKRTKKKK